MSFNPFLQQVAADLWSRFGEKLSELTIILPTRRSRLYLVEHLSRIIDKPLWQPTYLGMEELMATGSPLKQADSYHLLIELYRIYCKHKKTNENFDHFYFWGEAMLHDFDIIDKYRVNAQALFTNLANQKALEGDFSFLDEEQIQLIQSFWKTFDPLNKLHESFIEVWDVLYPIYCEFKETLRAKGIAYEGMVFRDLAEQLEQQTDSFKGTYVFIGLNALNECEKSLLRFLKKRNQALFYWDYDEYYVKNEQQEAGYFIRNNIREFPSEKLPDSFTSFSSPKSVEIIASTGEVMQAKLVPQLLHEIGGQQHKHPTGTAIIPVDERLLTPLLYALSDDEDVNVTMGYPLTQTPVFTLAELLIRLQRNRKESASGTSSFYHKDVQNVVNHPYVKRLSGNEGKQILQTIAKNNHTYVSKRFFYGNAFLRTIFAPASDYVAMTDYLSTIITNVAEADLDDNASLRREYAFHFLNSLRRLKSAISEEQMEIGLPVFFSLLNITLRKIRIPFSGEPLSGTQVMGILETRALDFENVIMLSVNEGTLPGSLGMVSFIPYNLRKGFGIPSAEQHEAMYAYYFYRLIQRAKNVRLLYSTKADDGSPGEMSRYLYQLKMESEHHPKERMLTYGISIDRQREIAVEKTDILLNSLTRRAEYGLSPSAISTYVACSLQFYFRYLLELRETEEVEEEVGMASFGNILHRSVEKLYKPYIGKSIDGATIKQILRNKEELKQQVNLAFAHAYFNSASLPNDFEQNGKLSIVRDVVLRYVEGILKYDAEKRAPFELKMVEQEVNVPYSFEVNGQLVEINLKGIIDRLDEAKGHVNIVDYKTGRNKSEFKGVEALFSESSDKQNGAVLQTFLYSLMYEKMFGVERPVTPTLYFVRNIFAPDFNHLVVERVDRTKKQEVLSFAHYRDEFASRLNETLKTMFNSEQPFTQTTDAKICKSCPFAAICGR